MCGIAAIVGQFAKEEVAKALERMLNAQMHRGPDDGGMIVIETGQAKVALGNRRLAILDVSPLGHQPMTNPDTGDSIVYNGEIYNSPELRRTLEALGVRFRGLSDTEVLLRSYEHWGIECLQTLKGMFAFALWDVAKQRVILARDHLGIKPLYYSVLPAGGLVCASEIRALLAAGLIPREVSRAGLAGYLAYGAVQEPLTILKGVFSLPPGSYVELDTAGQTRAQQTYWHIPHPDAANSRSSAAELVEQGRSLLRASVKSHLLSDVPVGVFLSSGLDSTAVLRLACEVSSTTLHAFTVSTPDAPEVDEAPLAKQAVQGLDVVHHVFPVDASIALDWAQDGLNCQDQPAMDGLNTYIVSRAVKATGIKVALSGQGGDEIFGGYRSFRGVPLWHRRLQWLRRAPVPIQNAIVTAAKLRLNSVARGKMDDIISSGDGIPDLYFQHRRLLSNTNLQGLGLDAQALGMSPSYHASNFNERNGSHPVDSIALVGRLESTFYLGNTLLRDGDVFGMANSLEIRVPMLDKDLVEWAFRLPGNKLLPKGRPNKFLLREMFGDFYTASQKSQAKLGFSLPIASWLLGPLREMMEQSLTDLSKSGLLNPEGITRVKEGFLNEPKTAAWSRVWALISLGSWLRSSAGAS